MFVPNVLEQTIYHKNITSRISPECHDSGHLLPVPIVRSYGTIGVKLHKYTNFGGGLQLKECFNGTSMEPTWCLLALKGHHMGNQDVILGNIKSNIFVELMFNPKIGILEIENIDLNFNFQYQFSSTNPASAWWLKCGEWRDARCGGSPRWWHGKVNRSNSTREMAGDCFDLISIIFLHRCWSMKLIRNPLISAVFCSRN